MFGRGLFAQACALPLVSFLIYGHYAARSCLQIPYVASYRSPLAQHSVLRQSLQTRRSQKLAEIT